MNATAKITTNMTVYLQVYNKATDDFFIYMDREFNVTLVSTDRESHIADVEAIADEFADCIIEDWADTEYFDRCVDDEKHEALIAQFIEDTNIVRALRLRNYECGVDLVGDATITALI